jgi:hypothetical protein
LIKILLIPTATHALSEMTFNSEEEAQWLDAFQQRLKKRTFEQFSILLLDFNECCQEQKRLLEKILFDDHNSVDHWSRYIRFVSVHFDQKNQLQLQRLINKALEFLNEKQLKDNSQFLEIHILLAKLKR